MAEQAAAEQAAALPPGPEEEEEDEEDPWASMFSRLAGGAPPASKPARMAEQVVEPVRLDAAAVAGWSGVKRAREALCELWSTPLADGGQAVVSVDDFLPPKVALSVLQALELSSWELASHATDKGAAGEGAGSTRHLYGVGDGDGNVNHVLQFLEKLLPECQVAAFQAAKYGCGHFIEPHDDVAYKQTKKGARLVRKVAVVLHLSQDWTSDMGGLFENLEAKQSDDALFVPRFNTLVAFRVPLLHQVTPILTTTHERFSVFGWFYGPSEEAPAHRERGTKRGVRPSGSGSGSANTKKKNKKRRNKNKNKNA